nr:hypothetical protein [Tanacetum cinerariifolium]
MVVTLKNNDKKIRSTKHIPLSGNTSAKTTASTNVVSNTPVLSSTGVNLLSSASGSQPQSNIKNDRIQRAPSKAKKNKLEDHHRTVGPSLNKKSVVDTKAISSVTNSKLNVNADLKCATFNGWQTFTLVGNVCLVKGKQENDKIGTKQDKNGKCRKARRCQRPIIVKQAEKEKKTQTKGKINANPRSCIEFKLKTRIDVAIYPRFNLRGQFCQSMKDVKRKDLSCNTLYNP